ARGGSGLALDDPPGFPVPPASAWYRFALRRPGVTVALMTPENRAALEEDLTVLTTDRPMSLEEYEALAEQGRRGRKHAGHFPSPRGGQGAARHALPPPGRCHPGPPQRTHIPEATGTFSPGLWPFSPGCSPGPPLRRTAAPDRRRCPDGVSRRD